MIMLLTEEIIEKAISSNGGFSKAQLKALGFNEFYKGWLKHAMEMNHEKEDIELFINLKDKHLK